MKTEPIHIVAPASGGGGNSAPGSGGLAIPPGSRGRGFHGILFASGGGGNSAPGSGGRGFFGRP